ncbi:hypothetical protein CB1_001340021 [Camelus ferus]|nr:hypothetical protein CB1_001340021 [Camelus ferus]
MSSPKNATAESGKGQKGEDSDMKNLDPSVLSSDQEDLPSSSQDMTPRSVSSEILESEVNLEKEFMALGSKNLPAVFNSGNELHDRDKNRYQDTLSYVSTRVLPGENKDYINASYIKIVHSGEEYNYIATQGPLPGTTDDFWQMVVEDNSNVIVIITREVEDGVMKCHHYWPISMKKPLELKSCHVFLENYQILQSFVVRIFQVVRSPQELVTL